MIENCKLCGWSSLGAKRHSKLCTKHVPVYKLMNMVVYNNTGYFSRGRHVSIIRAEDEEQSAELKTVYGM